MIDSNSAVVRKRGKLALVANASGDQESSGKESPMPTQRRTTLDAKDFQVEPGTPSRGWTVSLDASPPSSPKARRGNSLPGGTVELLLKPRFDGADLEHIQEDEETQSRSRHRRVSR